MRRAHAPLLLAAAVLLLLVPGAGAHAVLLASEPAKGTRLDEAPASVSVTLTEPADPAGSSLVVLDAGGRRVDLDDLRTTGGQRPTMRVSLPSDLPDGAYRMRWQALSGTDGHTTSGTVGFAVGDFAPPGSTGAGEPQPSWEGAAGRFLAFLGLALAFGAAVFLAWVPGAATVPRRPVLEALLAGTAVHLLGVALLFRSTLDETGLGATDLLATGVGRTLALRLGLALGALVFALFAASPRMPARLPPYVAVLLLAWAALGSARFGHASIAGLGGVAVDAMHLFAATAWAGGLLVFLWLLREARHGRWTADQVRLAGVRFGTAALMAVVVLLGAGVGATLTILGPEAWDPGTLASSWGAVLAAKLAVTLAMLAVAFVNRYGILEPPAAGGVVGWTQRQVTRVAPRLRVLEGGATGLRRLVRVEALLGVATLALAGALTALSPPALADDAPTAFEAQGFGLDFHGTLTATPAPAVGGTSRIVVHVETHSGQPVEGNSCGREPPLSCVTARVGGNETGGGETHALQPLGGGDWAVDGVLWTAPGDVPVRVTVSTAAVFADEMAFTVAVQPNAR